VIRFPAQVVRRCFIDTSAYYALSDRDERHHPVATEIVQLLQHQRWTAYTSNFTIAEQYALHLSRLGREAAIHALLLIERSNARIVRIAQRDEVRAREILLRYTDKAFSYVDATSFAVMERLAIQYAFTFDDDFDRYGFTRLSPELLRSLAYVLR
jgi:predicted nucleic acid-binding protein